MSRIRSRSTPIRTLAGVMLALGDQSFLCRHNNLSVLDENANKRKVNLDSNPKTFVEQKPKPEGVRNAPCSCRSGKKFKKCCGKAPSYEIDSHGNHRIAQAKAQEPKETVKELNFQNLAGLDDATIEKHFNTEGAETGRYQSATPNVASLNSGGDAADAPINADGVPTGA